MSGIEKVKLILGIMSILMTAAVVCCLILDTANTGRIAMICGFGVPVWTAQLYFMTIKG